MNVVKFSPSTMTPKELLEQSGKTQTGLNNNTGILPSPPLTPKQLDMQDGVVEGKQKAQSDAFLAYQQATKKFHEEVTVLGNMVMQVATYVDGVAITNMATAESTANAGGFPVVQSAHHTTQVPDTINDLSVTQGDHSTFADLHFSPAHKVKAKIYTMYYSLNVTAFTWVIGNSDNKSSGTIEHLPTNVPIAYMVRGKNDNGEGADGNVVVKTIT